MFKKLEICLVLLVLVMIWSCKKQKEHFNVKAGDSVTFFSDGDMKKDRIEDSYSSDLVVYLAANQFMVMEDLIKKFQEKNSDVKEVFIELESAGTILNDQLLKQGQKNGKNISQNPDIFCTIGTKHLQKLHEAGLMDAFLVYAHNKLELLVASENPKKITGLKDLGRDDIVQSHPNPLTEPIHKSYLKPMLEQVDLYEKISGGKECKGCWAVENKVWFTESHLKETPERIEKGQADVGIVWATFVREMIMQNRKVEGVTIDDEYNQKDKVIYVAGVLKNAKHTKNAEKFLQFLSSPEAQGIYERYGFTPGSPDELTIKNIE